MSVGERIRAARKAAGMTQKDLGDALGVTQSVVSDMEAGKLQNWPLHAPRIISVLGKSRAYFEPNPHIDNTPDLPVADPTADYVPIEVLPTYGGMGGGGTGDGDVQNALMPRHLVVNELHAKPSDLLLVNVRGDSMTDFATGRGFLHGDQLLIDRRDTNPRQPGPFALWYDDGYVVKNVEIIRSTGRLRIFSTNPAYSDDEADPDDVRIIGRPVWFARRL